MKRGEFELIENIRRRFRVPDGCTGIGDDCAILPQRDGFETLVTTDLLVEGVHFLRSDASPFDLGWKSAAVNLSDIAGMGGKPTGTFLSIAVPKNLDDAWLDSFMDGYQALSDRFNVPLLGGDTSSSLETICINVTVTGECIKSKALLRSMALPGEIICVSGPLGDSAAGLDVILSNIPRTDLQNRLVQRHYRPMPRIPEGQILASMEGVSSMMDISDGIGSDLRHILKASGISAEVELQAIPLSEDLLAFCSEKGLDPLDFAVNGGEDYELLFTVSPKNLETVQKKTECHPIGRTVPGASAAITWKGGNKDYKGFCHF